MIRIPASDEEISCWPAAISRNGPATWTAPRHARPTSRRPEPRKRARRARERRQDDGAASAIRVHATRRREVAEPDLDTGSSRPRSRPGRRACPGALPFRPGEAARPTPAIRPARCDRRLVPAVRPAAVNSAARAGVASQVRWRWPWALLSAASRSRGPRSGAPRRADRPRCRPTWSRSRCSRRTSSSAEGRPARVPAALHGDRQPRRAARSRSSPALLADCDGDGDPANDRDTSQRTLPRHRRQTAGYERRSRPSKPSAVRLHALPPDARPLARARLRRATSCAASRAARLVATAQGRLLRRRQPARLRGRPRAPGNRGLPVRPAGVGGLRRDRDAGLSVGLGRPLLFLPGPGARRHRPGARPLLPCLRADPPAVEEAYKGNNARRDAPRSTRGGRRGAKPARPLPRPAGSWPAAGQARGDLDRLAAARQCASGEGGVSRRYHSASRAPMQPVPAAVTAWR